MSSLKNACCFCLEDFGLYGNDPWPLQEEGRCCDVCNLKLVIKERLKQQEQLRQQFEEIEKEDRSFNHEDSPVCQCRACILKEYVHIDRNYEIVEEQNSPPTNNAQQYDALYESSSPTLEPIDPLHPFECRCNQCELKHGPDRQNVVKEYDDSACKECGGYYTDHRYCDGMTREEIDYENYVNEYRGSGNFGRG